jgi:hypothetical protein
MRAPPPAMGVTWLLARRLASNRSGIRQYSRLFGYVQRSLYVLLCMMPKPAGDIATVLLLGDDLLDDQVLVKMTPEQKAELAEAAKRPRRALPASVRREPSA